MRKYYLVSYITPSNRVWSQLHICNSDKDKRSLIRMYNEDERILLGLTKLNKKEFDILKNTIEVKL